MRRSLAAPVWERCGEAGASKGWARADGDGSTVVGNHLSNDGEPESGSAVIARSRLVEAEEPFEDSFPVALGDAVAVVVDRQHHVSVVGAGDRDIDVGVGMAECVVDQVADHSNELALVAQDLPCRDPSGAHCSFGGNPMRLGERDVIEIDRFPANSWVAIGSSVAPGEQQQVLDEALHSKGLVEDLAGDLAQQLRVVASEADLEFVTDHRDWGSELVGGVGDEL